MKPYLRERSIKGCGGWKVDHHARHEKGWLNWWEDEFDNFISRKTMKQKTIKDIEKELFI